MRSIRLLAGTVAAVLLLYLSLRGIRFSDAAAYLQAVRWSSLSPALLLVLLSPWVRAWRWKELFSGKAPRISSLAAAVAIGQTIYFAVPFRVSEVVRVLYLSNRKLEAAGTIALEKFLDVAFFAVLCLLLPFWWAVPDWLRAPRASVAIAAVVYLVVVIVVVYLLPRISALPRIAELPKLRKLPTLLATSAFLWTSSILVNYFVIQALNLPVTFLMATVLLVILQVGVAVPSTPGKIGFFQYLAVLSLSLFGIAKAPALAVGLLLHLVVFVPVAAMAGVFWMMGGEVKE